VCSTDPKDYGEIIINLAYSNDSKIVELTILSLCTLMNFKLFSDDDYMIIMVEDETYVINAHDSCKISLEMMPTILDMWFKYVGLEDIIISLNECNQLQFICNKPFKITDMSYNFKLALGFYYIDEHTSYNFPIISDLIEENKYDITSLAVPLTSSTPVLYLLSNLGGKCYRMNLNDGLIQGGTVGMIINNAYTLGSPMIAQQADITTKCYSSDLTFVRLTLVDSNFRKIILLNPLYCTISINEIADLNF
jgi:hypothetical protein